MLIFTIFTELQIVTATNEATTIIMQKLFNENYAFQDEIYDFVESNEFIEVFHGAVAYNQREELTFDDIHDEVTYKAKEIAEIAKETDFEM